MDPTDFRRARTDRPAVRAARARAQRTPAEFANDAVAAAARRGSLRRWLARLLHR